MREEYWQEWKRKFTWYWYQVRCIGLEMVALKLKAFKMLQFLLGMIRIDRIRSECIRGTTQVGQFGDKDWVRWDWDGLSIWEGGMWDISGWKCRGWHHQTGGLEAGQRRGLWMCWRRTYRWLVWQSEMRSDDPLWQTLTGAVREAETGTKDLTPPSYKD